MGWTTCQSEKEDKQLWHGRWRARERTALSMLPLDDADYATLPVSEKQVSNVWDMGKDGRQYFPLRRQREVARHYAQRMARSRKERKAMEARLLHKFMGK